MFLFTDGLQELGIEVVCLHKIMNKIHSSCSQYIIGNLPMPKDQINQELYNLLQSLLAFLAILYKLHKPYIKGLALALIAYVCFRMGRMSVIDPLEQSVTKLWRILQQRAEHTIYLPQKIKKIAKIRTALMGVLTLSAAVWMVVYSFKIKTFKQIKVKYWLIYAITIISSLAIAWIYEVILKMRVKQGVAQDLTLNQKLYALQKQLGPRVQGILKIFLCKQSILKRPTSPRGLCVKDNCKNYRLLLKQKTDGIEYLVNSAMNFSWCFICRKKAPFNEFIEFQAKPYANESLPEQQQIIRKNEYLIQELLRMSQWVKDVSPCNCSQIYWRQSLKYIKQFKRRQKQIDKNLLFYENRQIFRRV